MLWVAGFSPTLHLSEDQQSWGLRERKCAVGRSACSNWLLCLTTSRTQNASVLYKVVYLISFIWCPPGIQALLPKKTEPLALRWNEARVSTLGHGVSPHPIFDIGKPERVIDPTWCAPVTSQEVGNKRLTLNELVLLTYKIFVWNILLSKSVVKLNTVCPVMFVTRLVKTGDVWKLAKDEFLKFVYIFVSM